MKKLFYYNFYYDCCDFKIHYQKIDNEIIKENGNYLFTKEAGFDKEAYGFNFFNSPDEIIKNKGRQIYTHTHFSENSHNYNVIFMYDDEKDKKSIIKKAKKICMKAIFKEYEEALDEKIKELLKCKKEMKEALKG